MDKDSLMNQAKALDGSAWKNLLGFDKMLTPIIIKVLYFLGLLGVLLSAGAMLFQGAIFPALGLLIFGTLIVRVWCELLILMFRVYEELKSASQYLKDIRDKKPL